MMPQSNPRKGWCPGALRPMPAKDGLLVRLRISGGRLEADRLRAIAAAGRDHGNGRFDLTSRANLQIRGVAKENLPGLLRTLGSHGLLDATIAAESVRNVLSSPLAGLEAPIDIGPIAAALEAALVADAALHDLPGKFGFLIDDSSALSLAAVPADIRFTRAEPGEGHSSAIAPSSFAIALGGCESEAVSIGSCAPEEIVPIASRLAHVFLRLGTLLPRPPRRMRDLLRGFELATIAAAAGLRVPPRREPRVEADAEPCPIGPVRLGHGASCFGIGAAFGRLEASMLEAAAEAAEKFGTGEVRLTPWRALLLVGIEAAQEECLRRFLAARGFITGPGDARAAVAACGGRAACESATTDTRADALILAGVARRLVSTGIALHVSGCVKGCARPAATPYTLVARSGRYDLITNGAPGDAPQARGLTLAKASVLLDSIAQDRHASP